jgi:hypothetical protein
MLRQYPSTVAISYSDAKAEPDERDEIGWEMSSRGRFAKLADFPLCDCKPYRGYTYGAKV